MAVKLLTKTGTGEMSQLLKALTTLSENRVQFSASVEEYSVLLFITVQGI